MTITFMAPDLTPPSGGLRVIHALAESLERQGMPARVWHGETHLPDAGDLAPAPVVCADKLALAPGDALVITEVRAAAWAPTFGRIPLVVFVQGKDFVFDSGAELPTGPLSGDGDGTISAPYPGVPQAAGVLTASRSLELLMEEVLDGRLPMHRIPVEIDTALFASREKEKIVAYMPRRRRDDVGPVVELLARRPEFRDWRFAPIDGMRLVEVAETLGRSAIFLSGAEREGFGMPGAEAMAAGCAVVGFSGHGQTEYMGDGRADLIPESDVVQMMRAVVGQMARFESDRAAWDHEREVARQFIRDEYSSSRRDEAAMTAFRDLLGRPEVLIREPVVVGHYSSHRPRGVWQKGRVRARTWAGRARRSLRS